MLIAGAPSALEELGGEDLHVAGEDEQVDARRAAPAARPRPPRAAGLDRDVVEGEAERGDLLGVVGVVGDDGDDVGAELAAAPAPEQVGEAVVLARDHDRQPLALGPTRRSGDPSRAARRPPLEAVAQLLALAAGDASKAIRMKSRPSPLECWSASTMLSPASARKPLTAAIRPGRSGQASSSRVVGPRRSIGIMAARKIPAQRARSDPRPSGVATSCLTLCRSARCM